MLEAQVYGFGFQKWDSKFRIGPVAIRFLPFVGVPSLSSTTYRDHHASVSHCRIKG